MESQRLELTVDEDTEQPRIGSGNYAGHTACSHDYVVRKRHDSMMFFSRYLRSSSTIRRFQPANARQFSAHISTISFRIQIRNRQIKYKHQIMPVVLVAQATKKADAKKVKGRRKNPCSDITNHKRVVYSQPQEECRDDAPSSRPSSRVIRRSENRVHAFMSNE